MASWDVVVVGAGIWGSCAAYHCLKRGLNTLLIEQFPLNHNKGSSHGQSRIIRYAHTQPHYVPVVADSYKQIAELEKKRGEKLWRKTGLLWMGSKAYIDNISSILNKAQLENTLLTASEVCAKYPQFSYDDSWRGLVDPQGGVIFADKWMKAFQDEFVKLGGVIVDNTRVTSWNEAHSRLVVKTDKETYATKKIVLSTGSWISELTEGAGVKAQPERIAVTYWKAKDAKDTPQLQMDKLPVMIMHRDEKKLYGLPAIDYPDLIKFCDHHGDPFPLGKEPTEASHERIKKPSEHLRDHMPLIDSSQPARIDVCKYTNSPDAHYLIDFHPKTRRVIIAGCGSGSGFKVAPGVGRAVACMVAEEQSPFDLSLFSLNRMHTDTL